MGSHVRAAAPRGRGRRSALVVVAAVTAVALALLIGVMTAGIGSASVPAGPTPALVPGTPCTTTARACVDLRTRRAWLIDNGAVVRAAASVAAGDGQTPTPVGTFKVQWKAQQYTSREYLVQMPYAVFFADGGVAFHEGRQDTASGGCVKLVHDDAVAWFDFLQVGDQVQVH